VRNKKASSAPRTPKHRTCREPTGRASKVVADPLDGVSLSAEGKCGTSLSPRSASLTRKVSSAAPQHLNRAAKPNLFRTIDLMPTFKFVLTNPGDGKMKINIERISVDELWSLHQQICSLLASKMSAEIAQLETRLSQLTIASSSTDKAARRPYPPVVPKFRNPVRPSETWAGRGKQPRWMTAQLRSGKKLDDFRIRAS